jgi:carbamoyl-phosphate synthase large subunit
MVNCNPETVSTDYDTSDKLYFEPLTVEDVLSIYHKEKPEGVIVQFGGQTPLNICRELERAGVRILGTSPDTIDLAEDRDRFRIMMGQLKIPQPASGMAHNLEEAIGIAEKIGYPLMVRPSYVLGGRGMEVVHDQDHDIRQPGVETAASAALDRQISGKRSEVEADAISDGSDAFIRHHDTSACDCSAIQPASCRPSAFGKHQKTIEEYTKRMRLSWVRAIIQYAIANDRVSPIPVPPPVPLVSKSAIPRWYAS